MAKIVFKVWKTTWKCLQIPEKHELNAKLVSQKTKSDKPRQNGVIRYDKMFDEMPETLVQIPYSNVRERFHLDEASCVWGISSNMLSCLMKLLPSRVPDFWKVIRTRMEFRSISQTVIFLNKTLNFYQPEMYEIVFLLW